MLIAKYTEKVVHLIPKMIAISKSKRFLHEKIGLCPTSVCCQHYLVDEEVRNYFNDVAIDSEPSNCSKPCTTLDISNNANWTNPRMAGSMVKLIMDRGGRQVQHGHLQADC